VLRDRHREAVDLECDLVQGYFLSRPIPTVEMTDWLAEHADTLEEAA